MLLDQKAEIAINTPHKKGTELYVAPLFGIR